MPDCLTLCILPIIQRCADNLVTEIRSCTGKYQGQPVNMKKHFGAFAMDVIAASAFGLDLNSQQDPENKFVVHAKKAMDLSITNFRTIILLLCPQLIKVFRFLRVPSFPKDVTEFFMNTVNKTIAERKENGTWYPDILQMMLQHRVEDPDEDRDVANNENLMHGLTGIYNMKGLTHEEILAQSLLFFIAGYETMASTLTFLAYCLATNPHCQEKLHREIDGIFDETTTDNVLDYTSLTEMVYLDMCISEALRLFPPVIRLFRVCTRDTRLGDVPIQRGMLIAIPAYSLHRHPAVWVNPEQFVPERFSREQKGTWDQLYYMPFGHGQRNCIGKRLALLEVKVAMVQLLREFEFHVSRETQIPPTFKKGYVLQPTKDVVLQICPRNHHKD